MGSENIFVRKKKNKKKKKPVGTAQGNCARNNCAYAELSKTGCRRCRSDGSAARPRCPAGGAGRAAALPLSPHHAGGYVPLKAMRCFLAACRGISPVGSSGGSQPARLRGQAGGGRGRPSPLSREVTPDEPCGGHLAENSSVDFSTYTNRA